MSERNDRRVAILGVLVASIGVLFAAVLDASVMVALSIIAAVGFGSVFAFYQLGGAADDN